jgi:hypothetical protein
MYIEEYEYIEVVLTNNSQISKWLKKLDFIPEINKPFFVHWSKLKTTTYRRKKIKLKCDECLNIFEKDTRNLEVDNKYHLCNSCMKKGKNNPQYGKEKTDAQKNAHKKWMEENGNPFTWESVKKKLKEKQEETTKKVVSKITGTKRTKETRKKMSESIRLAYKEGRLKPGTGYNNIRVKKYKGLHYQGTYELKFLKYVESFGKLYLIERGPNIQYELEDGEHTYLVDYMIKNTNIIFEIKSSYYWKKNESVNIIKKEYAEKSYEYNLVINNNFSKIEKYFKEDI